MYRIAKQEMRRISNYCGNRVDYVQGGGGNTSIKFDDTLMAIKASGYTLKETTEDKGYVTVDYQKIRQYYQSVDPCADRDYEKESLALNLDSVVLLGGMENKRPSVEVGFHSFLPRCVVHTHSVYANMLCCSVEGKNIAAVVLKGSGISYAFVPYIDPGFRLTLAIKDAVQTYKQQRGCLPDVVFMENHGIVASNDDTEKAIAIHEEVNTRITHHFELGAYPKPRISKTAEGYKSDTAYLNDFVLKKGCAFFETLKLYPDQLVYINKKLGDAVRIGQSGIYYNTTEKEATVIEETLLGAAFVVGEIEKAGLKVQQMNKAAVNFINNWESEKYRSKLAK